MGGGRSFSREQHPPQRPSLKGSQKLVRPECAAGAGAAGRPLLSLLGPIGARKEQRAVQVWLPRAAALRDQRLALQTGGPAERVFGVERTAGRLSSMVQLAINILSTHRTCCSCCWAAASSADEAACTHTAGGGGGAGWAAPGLAADIMATVRCRLCCLTSARPPTLSERARRIPARRIAGLPVPIGASMQCAKLLKHGIAHREHAALKKQTCPQMQDEQPLGAPSGRFLALLQLPANSRSHAVCLAARRKPPSSRCAALRAC